MNQHEKTLLMPFYAYKKLLKKDRHVPSFAGVRPNFLLLMQKMRKRRIPRVKILSCLELKSNILASRI